jgi:hypothetical protein
MSTQAWMSRQDNRPPKQVKAMKVRRSERSTHGRYCTLLETSATQKPGSVRLSLFDAKHEPKDEPVAIKRFQVDNWREAREEHAKLQAALQNEQFVQELRCGMVTPERVLDERLYADWEDLED